jgi:hypothetical protein
MSVSKHASLDKMAHLAEGLVKQIRDGIISQGGMRHVSRADRY